MEKISIIIPVFNVEKYLKRCLESVLSQTYYNIEIILIDDGSQDKCGRICDEYAANDSRIVVIHKKNEGLSIARNCGIEMATGDYICFVDSDDYISPDYCQKLYNAIVTENADIAMCRFIRFSSDKCNESIKHNGEKKVINSVDALKEIYLADGELFTVVWNKMYKKSVIGDIRYPQNRINEDEFTTYKFFLNAKKIVEIYDVLYFYFWNTNSITTKDNYLENEDIYDAFDERIILFSKDPSMKELLRLTNKAYLDRIIFRSRKLIKNKKRNIAKKLHRKYKLYYKKHPICKKLGKGYQIYYYNPRVYYLLLSIKEACKTGVNNDKKVY